MKLSQPQFQDQGDGGPMSGAGTHNHSVLRAVSLISCFVESSEGRTLTSLARQTRMHVSTAFRILRTLTATGVLYRSPGEDLYYPGPMMVALSGTTLGRNGFGPMLEVLRSIAENTGETVSVGIRDKGCVVTLAVAPSPRSEGCDQRPGVRINLHCSAMGKVLLAAENAGAVTRLAAELGALQPMTPHSVTDPVRVAAMVQETRERGWGFSQEEDRIGVVSLAVAIQPAQRENICALGLHIPLRQWSAKRQTGLIDHLRFGANELVGMKEFARLPIS